MEDITKHIRRKKIVGNFPFAIVFTSMTFSLFVLGIFCFILLHAKQLKQFIQESIEVHVVLSDSISTTQKTFVETQLRSKSYVLSKNDALMIKYLSKEDARKEFIHTYGEDFMKVLDENPLKASFILKVQPEYLHRDSLAAISKSLATIDQVKEVYYLEDLADKINKNIKLLTLLFISFAIILIFITILLINNTIKLALYSQRFLIRSMQLVGATQWFIQKPFLYRATMQGLTSGITASALIYGIIFYISTLSAEFSSFNTPYLPYVFIILIMFGILLGFLSSWLAIRKYLKMSLDELY
jgi:cell division transport system permease protein